MRAPRRATALPTAAAAAGLALLTIAGPLRAQAPSPATPRPARERPGFVFAAVGVDPTPRYSPSLAYTATGGYEYRLGRSPWGVRAAGEYWRAVRRYSADDAFPGSARRPATQITTLTGGGLALTYHLPAVGRLRPYTLGGVGYQQLSLRNESVPVRDASGATGTTVFDPPERRNSMTYSAGLGAARRTGIVTVFGEARVTVLPNGGAHGGRPIQSRTAPVTIGVRF